MTKTKVSDAEKGFSRLGDLIYRQMPDGTTVVSPSPYAGRKSIQRGKTHQERFQKAASYARFAAKKQPIYAELAKGTKKSAYNLARSDWFNPPVIHEVRYGASQILVQASDIVMVTKVVITILNEQGKLLEAGQATRKEEDWWEYRPTIPGKILTVEAWDLAGNVIRLVL